MNHKVLLLNGSPHEKGCTARALEEVGKTLNEEGIETEIVLLPVNAYWYDYTSLGISQREYLSQKVADIAADYGAKEVDLSDYSYEPGLLTDAVHPWQKGWLLIDETIYSFYTNQEPAE